MDIPFLGGTKIKRDDFIVLCTTLSWMVSAGLSAREGVAELLNDKNNKMAKPPLEKLRDEIDDGKPLSQIFKDNEAIFGTGLWRQLDAAERTGKVPECLVRLADQAKNSGDLAGKVKSALTYPSAIMALAFVAGYYMFTTIVPDMGAMMVEFGVEMPEITRIMMQIADFLIANGVFVIITAVAVIGMIVYLLNKPFRMQWHTLLTKIPVIGAVSVNMNFSSMYLLLNDMIENGANIVESLRVAASGCDNNFIESELVAVADRMDLEGISLTEGLLGTTTMPSEDKLMLQIGQKTGRDVELLPDLAERRRKAAYDSVGAVMELLPSIVLLVVSGLVAVMVVSIYMPMISLATDIA